MSDAVRPGDRTSTADAAGQEQQERRRKTAARLLLWRRDGGWRSTGIRVRLGLALALALSPVLVLGVTGAVMGVQQASADQRADLSEAAVRVGAGVTVSAATAGARPVVTVSPAAGLPRDTAVAVLDGQGRFVANTNDDVIFEQDLGTDWSNRAPVFTAEAADGRKRLLALAPLTADPRLAREGWRVLLSAPGQSPASFAKLNALGAVGLPLLAFLLALGAVWLVADRVVVRWLQYLQRVAAIYAGGRFNVRPVEAAAAAPELRDLAHTLDTMADTIEARDASLQGALGRQDALMREIHHRVKNNLQVITSLLNMQQRGLKDPAAQDAISDTRQRITALSLIYKSLYQGADLRHADLRDFLEQLLPALTGGDLGRSAHIRTRLDCDALVIDPDRLAPLALYAVEAITNARKHAFGDEGGTIAVTLRVRDEQATFEVADDGRGGEEAGAATRGVGSTLMTAFARQLRGASEVSGNAQGGVTARLTFPAPKVVAPEAEDVAG